MLGEELQRPRPGEGGAGSVVALAVIAVEAVIGGIDVDLDLRVRRGDFLHACDRDVLILLAEMQ
jgi:hypothetical protein